MHYVILWIVLSRMSIQPAHAHRGKRDGMTKSSAWGELVPRSGEDYGDKGMVYPASPAGLVLRSWLVGSDLHSGRNGQPRKQQSCHDVTMSEVVSSVIIATLLCILIFDCIRRVELCKLQTQSMHHRTTHPWDSPGQSLLLSRVLFSSLSRCQMLEIVSSAM